MGPPAGLIEAADSWRMEQFSQAYVKAVASVAKCSVVWESVDLDSVDGTLKKRTANTVVRSPVLDFQLKATSQDIIRNDHVAFPLSIKNYDELRAQNVSVPRILVVVVVPAEIVQWTRHSEAELALRRCGYWVSLRGGPAVTNDASKTVHLPRVQLFEPAGLDAIFGRLERGALP